MGSTIVEFNGDQIELGVHIQMKHRYIPACGPVKCPTFGRSHRLLGRGQGSLTPAFHFNDVQYSVSTRDQIQFPGRTPPIAMQNDEAFGLQIGRCPGFSLPSGFVSIHFHGNFRFYQSSVPLLVRGVSRYENESLSSRDKATNFRLISARLSIQSHPLRMNAAGRDS